MDPETFEESEGSAMQTELLGTGDHASLQDGSGQIVGQLMESDMGQLMATEDGQLIQTGTQQLMDAATGQLITTTGHLIATAEGQIVDPTTGQIVGTTAEQDGICYPEQSMGEMSASNMIDNVMDGSIQNLSDSYINMAENASIAMDPDKDETAVAAGQYLNTPTDTLLSAPAGTESQTGVQNPDETNNLANSAGSSNLEAPEVSGNLENSGVCDNTSNSQESLPEDVSENKATNENMEVDPQDEHFPKAQETTDGIEESSMIEANTDSVSIEEQEHRQTLPSTQLEALDTSKSITQQIIDGPFKENQKEQLDSESDSAGTHPTHLPNVKSETPDPNIVLINQEPVEEQEAEVEEKRLSAYSDLPEDVESIVAETGNDNSGMTCLYCEKSTLVGGLIDASSAHVKVGEKEMDLLTIVKMVMPENYASGATDEIAPNTAGPFMCDKCCSLMRQLVVNKSEVQKTRSRFMERCKEGTYINFLQSKRKKMPQDLKNADKVCCNCDFGKKGSMLKMYSTNVKLTEDETTLQTLGVIAKVDGVISASGERFLCGACFRWVKNFSASNKELKKNITEIIDSYRCNLEGDFESDRNVVKTRTESILENKIITPVLKVEKSPSVPSPRPRGRPRLDKNKDKEPVKPVNVPTKAKKEDKRADSKNCANCLTSFKTKAKKFGFKVKSNALDRSSDTLLDIIKIAIGPCDIDYNITKEEDTKFICEGCYVCLTDFTKAKPRMESTAEKLKERVDESAYIQLYDDFKDNDAKQWLKSMEESNCICCSEKLPKTGPGQKGFAVSMVIKTTNLSVIHALILMLQKYVPLVGSVCQYCMNIIITYAESRHAYLTNVKEFFNNRQEEEAYLALATETKPIALQDYEWALNDVTRIKSKAFNNRKKIQKLKGTKKKKVPTATLR